jgi:hypothetical protein
MESPEVWFEDVMRVHIVQPRQQIPIDQTFLELVEAGSLLVTSAILDRPCIFGVRVIQNTGMIELTLQEPLGSLQRPTLACICVRGIRLGRVGQRFRPFTQAQMERNDAFWRNAYES